MAQRLELAVSAPGKRKLSSLEVYASRMGRLSEQHLSRVALLQAKREAEDRANEAQVAMRLAAATATSLEIEMDRRLSTEARLSYVSNHDMLTGLANRAQLEERLKAALAATQFPRGRVALILVDVDHFRKANESLGYAAGDHLLRRIGERLSSCVTSRDCVARLAGDQYAIVWSVDDAPDRLSNLLDRLLTAFDGPFDIEGQQIFLTISMGVSLYPEDGHEVERLIQNADFALNRSKERGRRRFELFDPTLNQIVHRRTKLEQELYRVIAKRQLFLAYQPQVNMTSGAITGVEALARWHHPELGAVPPTEFIPIAEAAGLIGEIGSWVLQEGCEQAMRWRKSGIQPVRMAINLSTAQLQEGDLFREVRDVLKDTGLSPGQLELEVTESALMLDTQNGNSILKELRKLGVSIAIDDFGTGYSSLGYLRTLPVDTIKIDRSFVTDVATDKSAAAIVSTIVTLARNLELEVTAEGIETAEHAAFIHSVNCNSGQGYYYSKPLNPDEIGELYREEGKAVLHPRAGAEERTENE